MAYDPEHWLEKAFLTDVARMSLKDLVVLISESWTWIARDLELQNQEAADWREARLLKIYEIFEQKAKESPQE